MNLPADPVRSMEDATLNFEALQALGVLGSKIAGSVQVAAGSQSVAMAAATAGSFAIVHGLTRVPRVAFAIPDGGVANDLTVGVTALGTTSFTVTWRRASGVNAPSPLTWWWIAVG